MTWMILAGVLAPWIVTRVAKLAAEVWSRQKFEAWMLFVDGGMPSSHAAFVFGLTSSVYLESGPSLAFFVALIFAIVVSYDAMKVRWIVGEHSRRLNEISPKNKRYTKLEERVGHTFTEVIVGAIIGIIVPVAVYSLF